MLSCLIFVRKIECMDVILNALVGIEGFVEVKTCNGTTDGGRVHLDQLLEMRDHPIFRSVPLGQQGKVVRPMQSVGGANNVLLNCAYPMAVVPWRDPQYQVPALGDLYPNACHAIQDSIPRRETSSGGLLELVSLVRGQARNVREPKECYGVLGDVAK